MRKTLDKPLDNSPAKQQLRRRIALVNRPHLNIELERIDAVACALAKSKSDRAEFMENPTTYLQGQALPVSSCTFVEAGKSAPQTSEVCSSFVVCNSYVNVNVQCVLDCSPNVTWMVRAIAAVIGFETNDTMMSANAELKQGSQVL